MVSFRGSGITQSILVPSDQPTIQPHIVQHLQYLAQKYKIPQQELYQLLHPSKSRQSLQESIEQFKKNLSDPSNPSAPIQPLPKDSDAIDKLNELISSQGKELEELRKGASEQLQDEKFKNEVLRGHLKELEEALKNSNPSKQDQLKYQQLEKKHQDLLRRKAEDDRYFKQYIIAVKDEMAVLKNDRKLQQDRVAKLAKEQEAGKSADNLSAESGGRFNSALLQKELEQLKKKLRDQNEEIYHLRFLAKKFEQKQADKEKAPDFEALKDELLKSKKMNQKLELRLERRDSMLKDLKAKLKDRAEIPESESKQPSVESLQSKNEQLKRVINGLKTEIIQMQEHSGMSERAHIEQQREQILKLEHEKQELMREHAKLQEQLEFSKLAFKNMDARIDQLLNQQAADHESDNLAEENSKLKKYLGLFQLKFKRGEQRRLLQGKQSDLDLLRGMLDELESDRDNQEIVNALLDSSSSALVTLLREKTQEAAKSKREHESLLSRIHEKVPKELRAEVLDQKEPIYKELKELYNYVEFLENELEAKDTRIKSLVYAPSAKERSRVEVEEDPGMGHSVSQKIEGHRLAKSSTEQAGTRFVHIVDKDIKHRLKRMESSLKFIDEEYRKRSELIEKYQRDFSAIKGKIDDLNRGSVGTLLVPERVGDEARVAELKRQLRQGELNSLLRLLLEAVELKDKDKTEQRCKALMRHVYQLMGESPASQDPMTSERQSQDFSLVTEKMVMEINKSIKELAGADQAKVREVVSRIVNESTKDLTPLRPRPEE